MNLYQSQNAKIFFIIFYFFSVLLCLNIILAFILEFVKLQIKKDEEDNLSFHSDERKIHHFEMRPLDHIGVRPFSKSLPKRQNTLPPPTIKEGNEVEEYNEDNF